MKKILFLIICMLITSTAFAIRTENWQENSLTVTYDLDDIEMSYSKEFDGYRIAMNGFGETTLPNKPQLLHRNETFVIPTGYKIESVGTTVIRADTIKLKAIPATPPTIDHNSVSTEFDYITPYEGVWPISSARLSKIKTYRGYRLGGFHLYPIQYDYNNECLIYSRQIKVTLNFAKDSSYHNGDENVTPEELNNLVSIPSMAIPSISTRAIIIDPSNYPQKCPGYLIIAPQNLVTQAERLADWKRSIGFNARVVSVNECSNKTPEYFHTLIKNEYVETYNLRYVVLFGDGDVIHPYEGSYTVYHGGEKKIYHSDFKFACLDDVAYEGEWYDDDFVTEDEDDMPDVYIGRIPAISVTQAKNMVDKIIKYEKEPAGDDRYYSHNILFSEFDGEDVRDQSYFIETCDNIYRGLNKGAYYDQQYEPQNIYLVKKDYVNPTYFKSGTLLPNYLRKPNYNWATSPSSFIEEWEKGNYLVGAIGHADTYQWLNNGITYDDMVRASCDNGIPVIFGSLCFSASFYHPYHNEKQKSLGLNLLHQPNRGTVSIIGTNNLTWSPFSDYIFAALYETMYPGCSPLFNLGTNPSFKPVGYPVTYELCKLLETARQRMMECFENYPDMNYVGATKEVYHILGDPSLCVKHGKPQKLGPQIIQYNGEPCLKDFRKLIFKSKTSNFSSYFDKDRIIPVSELIDYCDQYELCLVGDDVNFHPYLPEFITKDYLLQIEGATFISNVVQYGENIIVDLSEDSSGYIVKNLNLMGETIDMKSAEGSTISVKSTTGINIITLINDSGVIDSKRIFVK